MCVPMYVCMCMWGYVCICVRGCTLAYMRGCMRAHVYHYWVLHISLTIKRLYVWTSQTSSPYFHWAWSQVSNYVSNYFKLPPQKRVQTGQKSGLLPKHPQRYDSSSHILHLSTITQSHIGAKSYSISTYVYFWSAFTTALYIFYSLKLIEGDTTPVKLVVIKRGL